MITNLAIFKLYINVNVHEVLFSKTNFLLLQVFEKLKVLNVSYSKHLIEIPDFSNMPNVEILIVKGRINLIKVQSFIEVINLLVIYLVIFCLNWIGCENLMNLPGGIHKLKHLNTLCCTGCSKLKSFPEIMDMMENLRVLYLGRTGIKNLPWSIERLKGVQYLDLAHCENLESLPGSICNLRSLKTLLVHNCSKLSKFPDTLRSFWIESTHEPMGEELHFRGGSLSLSPRRSPKRSSLQPRRLKPKPGSPQHEGCKPVSAPMGPPKRYQEDQMEKAICSDSWSLCWLEELDLSYCNLKEGGIAREVFHQPPLQVLNLSGNNFCVIPPNIGKCSKLRILKMSHCKLLLQIPELPSSLREIDAHGCPLLLPLQRQTQLLHSLLNCFKSDIQV